MRGAHPRSCRQRECLLLAHLERTHLADDALGCLDVIHGKSCVQAHEKHVVLGVQHASERAVQDLEVVVEVALAQVRLELGEGCALLDLHVNGEPDRNHYDHNADRLHIHG